MEKHRKPFGKGRGKTIEFKENCRSLSRIVQSVVAFANTAGGVLVIGIRDRTKDVVGLPDPLADEEKLANAFADSIQPLLIPDIQISAWRDRELIIVSIPHTLGPYYVKSEGIEKGVYIRLGSTNRRAGPEIIEEIRRLSRNTFFDEQPCTEVNSEAIDFRAASEFFAVDGPLHRLREDHDEGRREIVENNRQNGADKIAQPRRERDSGRDRHQPERPKENLCREKYFMISLFPASDELRDAVKTEIRRMEKLYR